MPAVNNLDLGRIYLAGEQIKGMRTQNRLASAQLAAAQQPEPIDPDDLRRAIEWADTPEKWNQAVDVYVSEGRPEFARYRGQFGRREEFKALLAAETEKTDPKSPLGKLARDFESGLIDEADYRAAVTKATTTRPLVEINQGQTITEKLLDMDLESVAGTRDVVKAGEDFMPRLETIVQGLESGNVETGRWQEATLPIKQWAQSAGWYDDPNLGQQEAVLAAISYMIPRMRVVGSGQTSDVEIRLFANATAQFSNTPLGNILIARTMMQLQKRNKQLLEAQRAWLRKNKTLEGFDADKEIGPMFPKVTTQEDVDKLPSGTVFIHTADGRFKVKQ